MGGSFGLSAPGPGIGRRGADAGLDGGRLLIVLGEEAGLTTAGRISAPSVRSGLLGGLTVGAHILSISSVLVLLWGAPFPLPWGLSHDGRSHSALP